MNIEPTLEKESSGTVSALKEIFQTVLISLGIFFVIYLFLIQPHRIKGESMVPNFADGELMLTQKIGYYFSKPQRGDVVVFVAPVSGKLDFIKRIIGLPGEKIRIDDGVVYVDGEKLNEPYETQKTQGNMEISLGENQFFVLGDNRASSSDSRSFGPIDKDSIKGKSWIVYFPFIKTNNSKGPRFISSVNYSISDSLDNR